MLIDLISGVSTLAQATRSARTGPKVRRMGDTPSQIVV
jgi:hypothetical protein